MQMPDNAKGLLGDKPNSPAFKSSDALQATARPAARQANYRPGGAAARNTVNAETIAKALDGRRAGRGWIAPCPVHEDRRPSLSIRDAQGKVLLRCHAGCDSRDVIEALRECGLWGGGAKAAPLPIPRTPASEQPDPEDTKRTASALSLWEAAGGPRGTLAETYLASRKLRLPEHTAAIRFHASLRHPAGGRWPAMLARVTRGKDGEPLALHRTFLARNGEGKAPVEPSRMMLGPCRGGAVRLSGPGPGETLMVGEGIETVLSVMQQTGLPGWAALSTSGMRSLDVPDSVRDVIVLADGDAPGEAAAQDCARRWTREGRKVRIARPPWGFDFNDLLMGRAPRLEGAA
jgi:hypothetical protein